MKVLLVYGSPHKNGCTKTALDEIAEELKKNGVDSDYFWVENKPLSGCIACKSCIKNNKCVFDDRVNEFLEIAGDYDGYIFGTPVHWGGPSGAITSFLDRAFYVSKGRLAHKPAAAVVSCRRGGASATFDRLNKYFTISRMPVVSSQYWNSIHGMTAEEARQDLEGLQTMRTLADHMAWMLQCIGKSGVEAPENTEQIKTNFIR